MRWKHTYGSLEMKAQILLYCGFRCVAMPGAISMRKACVRSFRGLPEQQEVNAKMINWTALSRAAVVGCWWAFKLVEKRLQGGVARV